MAIPALAPRRPAVPDARNAFAERQSNTRVATIVGPRAAAYGRSREVTALGLWTVGTFFLLALLSYSSEGGANWVGPVGEVSARAVVQCFGVVAWTFPVELLLLGVPFIRGITSDLTPARVFGDVLLLVLCAALVQAGFPQATAFGTHSAAGLVGELFGEFSRSLFSTVGTFLVGFACLGLVLIGRASFSFIALAKAVSLAVVRISAFFASALARVQEAWRLARFMEQGVTELPEIHDRPAPQEVGLDPPPNVDEEVGVAEALSAAAHDLREANPKPRRARPKKKLADLADKELPVNEPLSFPAPLSAPIEAPETPAPTAVEKTPKPPPITTTPAMEEPKPKRGRKEPIKERPSKSEPKFVLPTIDFLVPAKSDPTLSIDREKLYANADKLVQTLSHYGVDGKVEDILPGPTVTTYEVSPAPGTKVSKVASLADDLALALASKVRIVAPIPGKNRIGFELPNERRIPVNLRDLVDDARFQSLEVPLPVVLGRDILGNPVYADLSAMPHVIVAGATGAGKSVGLNVMLTSLLYRRTPEELRLLMIDPKVVELAPFDRIPHMLLPVVTDMKQASNALKWAVDEMERRYQLFADAGTKNIGTYNHWVARVRSGEVKNPAPRTVLAKDVNGFVDAIAPTKGEEGEAPLPEPLPFIVIVVDEFADLMMQQGKEVEACVARLAQKARASGMHVILATQRPSVDVITGIIKANFPTRIAYRVSQRVDSRTILDEQGAEHLLGRGDMLLKLNGTSETRRVQCPMVSEEEVQRVTDHLRLQGEPVYDENILRPRDEDAPDELDDAEEDPLYDDAVRVVADTRRCSTSWLQRKLGLGYNRAARIVERMEKKGLVGPANGAKDREVLIAPL